MANNDKINGILDGVINGLLQLKEALNDGDKQPQVTAQAAPKPESQHLQRKPVVEQVVIQTEDLGNFDSLKKALSSEKWPEAVNPNLICDPNSETDKMERGRGIIELMIEEDLKGLKFLDIGCGEGHAAFLSADYNTAFSVGYDTTSYPSWEKFGVGKSNLSLTTDWAQVQANGPYNVVILFDVLDHIKGEDPIGLLKKAASVLAPNGKVYLRVHPHISRHGTHLYHSVNKAYAHLVFTPQEIKQLIPEGKSEEPSIGVLYPIKTYNDMIEKAGLKIENRRDITEKVEPFFKIPAIAARIMKNTGMNSFPEFQMSLQFIDYVLKK